MGEEREGGELMAQEVHIGTPIEQCRAINTRLLREEGGGGYEGDVFDNLIYRYEEPNGMTRWDSPLFTVAADDAAPPCEAIWTAMLGAEGKAKVVRPNMATVLVWRTLHLLYLCLIWLDLGLGG